ncbi:MAG: cytochrome C biosynthesis protein [Anaerolineaceae bacterium]|nr:cytochrome C biosynthesis protein [Anaerolineaceae bacterium]
MTGRSNQLILVCLAWAVLALGALPGCDDSAGVPDEVTAIDRSPGIRPDYSGLVIPPNIAPLNFVVNEPGRRYVVRIRGEHGEPLVIGSGSPEIIIPRDRWARLLEANRGGRLAFDVFTEGGDGKWKQFRTVTNTVAPEAIDPYLVYRLIRPIHNSWGPIGIYQRDLTSYDESLVVHNIQFGEGCVNCHAFNKNDPRNMILHTRGGTAGSATILVRDGVGARVNTKSAFGLTGYSSWHPNGKMIVCAVVKVRQFFHSAREEVRDVIDMDSTLVYYDIDKDTVATQPGLSRKDRLESYPCWAPDGRHLYFVSARKLWTNTDRVPPKEYKKVRYDLERISYDERTGRWGEPEMVLSSEETGLSITQPRISPDGRNLLFCMSEYGCFPVFQKSSDLYMMDLESGRYRRLPINSEETESWHSWSSNSRWIVFSSKRGNGLLARVYISHVAPGGEVGKQLVLPQKDPRFYDSFIKTYNVPELVTGPVPIRGKALARLIRTPIEDASRLPITSASPDTGAKAEEGAYRSGASRGREPEH